MSVVARPRSRGSRLRRDWRPTFRFTELQLLITPALITIVGLLTIYLAPRGDVLWSWHDIWVSLVYAGIIAGISVSFGVAGFRGDQLLLPITATLAGLGLLVIQRLHPDLAARGDAYAGLAQRQLLFLIAGLAILWASALFPPALPWLRRYKYTALLLSLGLMVATFFIGTEVYGARRWISIGPIQIQPSEIVKVTLVIFLAAYLEDKRDLLRGQWRLGRLRLPPVPTLLPMAAMWAASLMILVLLNDLGSALLFFGIFLAMIYIATARPLYIGIAMLSFVGACWFAWLTFGRVEIRVRNWINPWVDPLDTGFQQVQSDYAMASGGLFGTGFGFGRPALIPAVETDYILSAIGEELGLLGTLAIVALFLALVGRGLMIGLAATDGFTRLLAVGFSVAIAVQTMIIIGGVVRLIPLTGITLPFISYGGSSLLTNFLIIGLLLNISGRRATT